MKYLLLSIVIVFTGCTISPIAEDSSTISSISSSASSSSVASAIPITHPSNGVIIANFDSSISDGHTNGILIKEDKSIIFACEQQPFIFHGQVYDVITVRPLDFTTTWTASNTFLSIVPIDGTNQQVAAIGTWCAFGCALVKDDTLYIYGSLMSTNGTSRAWQCGQQPWVFYTKDLTNWQSNQCFSAPVPTTWNLSVCWDGIRFVMAMEVGGFNPCIATSPDGINWINTGYQYKPGSYTANPRIRYVGGYYYMIVLVGNNGCLDEYVTRSTDLINWTDSANPLIMVTDNVDRQAGPNCWSIGNMEFYEDNGRVNIYYCVCDQASWSYIRRAYYPGTMQQMFEWFY